MARINHELIRQRLIDLGLDAGYFQQVSGVHPGALPKLGPRDISLHLLLRISSALDIPLDELVTGGRVEQQASDVRLARRPEDPPDSAVVGAAVALSGVVDIDELAEALAWPASRVHAAAAALRVALDATGQRLATVDAELSLTLTPDTIPQKLHERLAHARQLRMPLHPHDARDLIMLVRDHILSPLPGEDHDFYEQTSRWDSRHLDHLVSRGIADLPLTPVPNADGQPCFVVPHPDLLFALGLTAEPNMPQNAAARPVAPRQDDPV